MSTRSGRERYRRVTEARRPAAPPSADGGLIRGVHINLGDLAGETVEPVTATFTWFGEQPGSRAQYRVNPDLTETVVIDLFEQAQSIKVTDVEQITGAKAYVREHIHPDDFERLWRSAKANRQNTLALMTLCAGLLEGIAERPTTPPSDSSVGRPDIRQSSARGASVPVADVSLPDVPGWWPDGVPYNPSAVKWVDVFEAEGRPDKADMLMLAQEARAGR